MLGSTQVIYHTVDKGEAGKNEGEQTVNARKMNGTRQQTERQVMNEEEQRDKAEGGPSILLPPRSMMKDSAEVRIDASDLGW